MAINVLQKKNLLTAVLLFGILVAAAFTYGRGYHFLPSDDPASSVIGARYMVATGTTDFLNPLTPDLGNRFYSNAIGTEFPVHSFLAQIFLVFGYTNILTIANIAMLSLFLFSGLLLFLVFFEATQSRVIAILGVGVVLFSRWYGQTFWTGHYAQIFGTVLLLLLFFSLIRFERTSGISWFILAVVIGLLLFPVHSLSFLVAFSSISTYLIVRWVMRHHNRNRQILLFTSYAALCILVIILARFLSRSGAYYPLFSVEDLPGGTVLQVIRAGYPVFAAPLMFLGAYRVLRLRVVTVAIWFLVLYFVMHSGTLGFPFFQYRFNEFVSIPLTIFLLFGIQELFSFLRQPISRVAVSGFIVVMSVHAGYTQQNALRHCHIDYCPGLNPVTILDEDYKAFLWLAQNTPSDARIIVTPKFGIYIPALAMREVVFSVKTPTVENAAYVALTSDSPERRWQKARESGASFVVWDGVMDRYQDTYEPYQVYSEQFDDERFFERVYDENGVRIYFVRSP